MRSHDSQPSGCTLFEQELVNAMNDFVNTAETPHFDTAVIERGARRKRATAIAGIATALVVACGAGTALAAGAVGSGSHTPVQTSAGSTDADSTTLLVRTSDGTTAKEQLAGVSAARARTALVHFGLTPTFTRVQKSDCKKQEDAVVALSPHAPTVVHAGDTVLVTTCYR
ncbi:hypothetical protein ACFZDK_55390 [Streptomyces sp. NPDC007901]|uniref:hypothetical protein n=1 Tax=Streptomyces sp. NPDC007901 TaxID=3364785 RepID=UPI0036E606FD